MVKNKVQGNRKASNFRRTDLARILATVVAQGLSILTVELDGKAVRVITGTNTTPTSDGKAKPAATAVSRPAA
jgi:hypothetical protein